MLRNRIRRLPLVFYNWLATVVALSRRLIRRLTGSSRTILKYPDSPDWYYTLDYLTWISGYNLTTDPNSPHDAAFYFEDATIREPDTSIMAISQKRPVYNLHSTNIGKRHISEVFENVFGYPILVDPVTYDGLCVEKSDDNGTHDGSIIQCPIDAPVPGQIYQKLVSGVCENGLLQELRIPVMGDSIPILFVKWKSAESRFFDNRRTDAVDPLQVLTEDQIQKVLQFCRELGLDFAELDGALSAEDGRLYIFDANNTPTIFWARFSYADRRRATRLLREEFDRQFLRSGKD